MQMDAINDYLDNIFSSLPDTPEVRKARVELLQMMEDKYTELVSEGMSTNEAVGMVISEFGNMSELSDILGLDNTMFNNINNIYEQKNNLNNDTDIKKERSITNRVLKVVGIVAALAVIIAVIAAGIKNTMPGKDSVADEYKSNASNVSDASEKVTQNNTPSADSMYTYDEVVDSFSNIQINVSVIDVYIQTGENYEIKIQCNELVKPEFEIKDNVLTLKTPDNKTDIPSNMKNECYITVPKDIVLDDIHAELSVGDIETKAIQVHNAAITASVGDVTISSSNIETLDVKVAVGDFNLNNTDFDNITAEVDTGDVAISTEKDLTEYSFDIQASLGEIAVNNDSYDEEYRKTGKDGKMIQVICSLGDVTVKY